MANTLEQAPCSLLASFQFLFLNQDRVKDIVGSQDLKDHSEDTSVESTIKELYLQCARCKAPKKPLISSVNFPSQGQKNADPLENVKDYLAEIQRGIKVCTLPSRDTNLIEEEVFGEILDYLLDEEEERRMQETPNLKSEYLVNIAYQELQVVLEEAKFEMDAVVEDEEEPADPQLQHMLSRLRNASHRKRLILKLTASWMSSPFALELVRFCLGDRDIDLTENETSENILDLFSAFFRQCLEDMHPDKLKKSGVFGIELPGQLSFNRYCWTPNISIGVFQLMEKFTQERANLSSDYFVPGSEYYSFQKTKVVKEIKVACEDQKASEDEQVTPFDRVEYPSMKDFISRLRKDNSYVTEDYDWKCVIFDFKRDTFRCLQYTETCDQIPYGLCDYAYFFGSRCLGWAKSTTLNILICTDRKLRYLNCLMKNINLFVAPNEQTPLRFLVEYIYRSTNIKLSISGSEADEFKEILRSLKFGIKFGSRVGWFRESDMDISLADLRQKINPNFSRESREVDLICLFRHFLKPQLVSYRSKEKRQLGEKVDIIPIYRKVEAIKCKASTVISYFSRWILGPKLHYTRGKPSVNGHYVSVMLPSFILMDVRLQSQLLFSPLDNIDFEYLGYLLQQIPYSHNHRYKLRGLICKRSTGDGSYFPVAIKANLQGFKSFETGWIKDVTIEEIPDSLICFVLIEREAPLF